MSCTYRVPTWIFWKEGRERHKVKFAFEAENITTNCTEGLPFVDIFSKRFMEKHLDRQLARVFSCMAVSSCTNTVELLNKGHSRANNYFVSYGEVVPMY